MSNEMMDMFQQFLAENGRAGLMPSDMRIEEYDGNINAAMELIEIPGMIEAMYNDALDAHDLARESSCNIVAFAVANGEVDGMLYPMEQNMEWFYSDDEAMSEIITSNAIVEAFGNQRVLHYFFDRGEYTNYFVEDFAPLMSIVSLMLTEDGIEMNTTGRSMFSRVLMKLAGGGFNTEVYSDNVEVKTSSAIKSEHSCQLRFIA